MPKTRPVLSSSLDAVALSDHIDKSLYQKTPLDKVFFQDMVMHSIVIVDRVAVVPYARQPPRRHRLNPVAKGNEAPYLRPYYPCISWASSRAFSLFSFAAGGRLRREPDVTVAPFVHHCPVVLPKELEYRIVFSVKRVLLR
jgi:hypothetical protein